MVNPRPLVKSEFPAAKSVCIFLFFLRQLYQVVNTNLVRQKTVSDFLLPPLITVFLVFLKQK